MSIDTLKSALEELLGEEGASCFTQEDLEKLHANRYRTEYNLRNASREGLGVALPLAPALVDLIINATTGTPSRKRKREDAAAPKTKSELAIESFTSLQIRSPSAWTPSWLCDVQGWSQDETGAWSHKKDKVLVHGWQSEDPVNPPLSLVHRAFAEFDLLKDGGDPAPDDYIQAARLSVKLDTVYPAEDDVKDLKINQYHASVSGWLNEWLAGENLLKANRTGLGGGKTDGTIMATHGVVANFEMKALPTKTTEMQNIHYYVLGWQNDAANRSALDRTYAPTLLICLQGRIMSIMAAASITHNPCVQPMAMVDWARCNLRDAAAMRQLARILLALRTSLCILQQQHLTAPPDIARPSQYEDFIPFFLQNTWPGGIEGHPLEDCKQYEPARVSVRYRLYTGKWNGQEVMVKVVLDKYPKEVHEAWAKADLAPQLLAHTSISNTRWTVIIMEWLQPQAGWLCCTDLRRILDSDQRKALADAVTEHLSAAHKLEITVGSTQGRSVHGDARDPNIFVRRDAATGHVDAVKFIDFDWAGIEGHARYPCLLHPSSPWHKDAKVGFPIKQEHDLHMVTNVLQ